VRAGLYDTFPFQSVLFIRVARAELNEVFLLVSPVGITLIVEFPKEIHSGSNDR